MKNRYATSILLLCSFLVTLMLCPLSLDVDSEDKVKVQELISPDYESAALVDYQPMKINVIPNPSFEDANPNGVPDYFQYYGTTHTYYDAANIADPFTGVYAGYFESMGSMTNQGNGYLRQTLGTSPSALMTDLEMSFFWNVLTNPDIDSGGLTFLRINTDNGTQMSFFYHLSYQAGYSPINSSISVSYLIGEPVAQWNHFHRNLTEDFIAGFGYEPDPTRRVISIFFYGISPIGASDSIRFRVDDVDITNGTYSYLRNGDFEQGNGNGWIGGMSSPLYMHQGVESIDGSYSLNLTADFTGFASAYGWSYISWSYPASYYADESDESVLDYYWKYDPTGTTGFQYAMQRLAFQNTSGQQFIYLVFGSLNDNMDVFSNTSSSTYYKIDSFGDTGVWQHAQIDISEYVLDANIKDMALIEIQFYMYDLCDRSQLLIDNFQLITYPTGDPGFEKEWFTSSSTPFAGWARWNGETGVISKAIDPLEGVWALNLTVVGTDSAGVYRNTWIDVHPHDFTNFSWRLDEMGSTTAYTDIELRFYGDNYISYILGGHPGYSPTNTSNYNYVYVNDYNVLDTWLHMVVNITADYEEIYGPSPDIIINRIVIDSYAVAGDRVSVLVDEMHFADGAPPVVDSVDFLPATPMYYDSVDVTIYAHDDRSGIRTLYVDYFDGTNWWGLPGIDMGGYYTVTIPAYPFDTEIQFLVSVSDNGGNLVIDNKGGMFYTYTVDDDVDPSLTITNPVNNTDVEGLLAINASVDDVGSGVEYVTFNPDGTGPINDYTAPYSQNWNLDDESLGSHFIIVTVRDNAGNTVTKTHYISVVDTLSPVLDSPEDVEFTVGETGHVIDWDPTDARPVSYEVFVEGVSTYAGLWNDSSEHIVIELNGLAVGSYNYTCVVTDDAGLTAVDTVMVTVNDVATTTASTTTAVTTTSTTTMSTSITTTTTIANTTTTSPTISTITTQTTSTTPSTPSSTTDVTTTTPTATPTTTTPPPGGDSTILLIAGALGVVVVLIVIVVVLRKKS